MEQNKQIDSSMEQLLQGMSYIINTIDKLTASIATIENELHYGSMHWMSIDQLVEYIPTHPIKPTIYQWVRYDKIPYHKIQGSLIFMREEIDQWLIKNG